MECKKESAQLRQQLSARHQTGATTSAPFILPVLQRIVNLLLPLEIGAIGALAVAFWALPAAWRERGYRGGVGGEWLLILLVGTAAAWLTARLLILSQLGTGEQP